MGEEMPAEGGPYSVRRLLAGLAKADRIAWKLMVIHAIAMATKLVSTKISQPILVL